MAKTVSKTRPATATPKSQSQAPAAAPQRSNAATVEPHDGNEWRFKVTGKGTSGWMSWVWENEAWVPLRASNTSFISAVAAIEPELMRLAFPHKVTARKAK